MMKSTSCGICQKPKASLMCGICQTSICKNCAHFLDANHFSFLVSIPSELTKGTYCGPCFSEKVESHLEDYSACMDKAKSITVFDIADSKLTRNFKRKEKPFNVQDCADREEALMRLAFLTVKAGFNALIDVSITAKKVRSGTYQTTIYSGSGIPVHLNSTRL